MTALLLILLTNVPPRFHPVPPEVAPYVHRLRGEPEFALWWVQHRDSADPLLDYIKDNTQDPRSRQRAWQARKKFGKGR